MLHVVQTYTEIFHLLFDPVKHGKSSSSLLIPVQVLLVGKNMLNFFSASHLSASSCPNPVSPTFVSPLPVSAAYVVPVLLP